MKNKITKMRSSNNRLSPDSYIYAFVIAEMAGMLLYIRFAATFYIYGERLRRLVVIAALLGGVTLLLSHRYERNPVSLMTGSALPVLVFETLSMCKYSAVIRVVFITGTIAVIAAAIAWAFKKTQRIHRESLKRRVFLSKAAYASRLLLCVLLLGTGLYGKYLFLAQYTVSLSNIGYKLSSNQNDIPDYENSLQANIATIAKIDPDGGWGELSFDEKIDVLETIERVECRYLGMTDSTPKLKVTYLEEGLLGHYDYESDTITLSYSYMIDSAASGYSVIQVLCHELYHRYQHYQIKLLETIKNNRDTEKYANLLLLYEASVYKEEMNNYVSPEKGSELSYYLYSSQRVERDAEKYGNSSMQEYYEKIQEYLMEPTE